MIIFQRYRRMMSRLFRREGPGNSATRDLIILIILSAAGPLAIGTTILEPEGLGRGRAQTEDHTPS